MRWGGPRRPLRPRQARTLRRQETDSTNPVGGREPSASESDLACCFYCVCDSSHFVGLVALINSLRLCAHGDPVVVLDCGLTIQQRKVVERAATVIPAPADLRAPQLGKWVAPRELPAPLMVLLDVDMIVVRSLRPVLRLAQTGVAVAFADEKPDRFHPGWAEAVGVPQLNKATYVNAGFLVLPETSGKPLLEGVKRLQSRVDLSRSRGLGKGGWGDPFYLPDQDTWNAVLGTLPEGRVCALDRDLAPAQPFTGVRLIDAQALRCRYDDGRSPYLLHHWGAEPWLVRTPESVYTTLLLRLVRGSGLHLRIPKAQLPRWLRGPLARRMDQSIYSRASGLRRRSHNGA